MKTINQHPQAGTVHRISGLILDGGYGNKTSISLYRANGAIHQISGDCPQGVVTIEPVEQPVAGWGLVGPLVNVTSPLGWSIIVEQKDIDGI